MENALIVSLTSLALGVPSKPKDTSNAVVLHRPDVTIPVHARASISSSRILDSETALPWCPHVLTVKPEPEYNFLALRECLAILEIRKIRVCDIAKRCFEIAAGLVFPAAVGIPRSLA